MLRNNINPRQLEGRLKNAAAQFLSKQLVVPKIFIEAQWPDRNQRVDVLAVDRAGAGDIHVVEVKTNLRAAAESVGRLMLIPAHYRYIATVDHEDLLIPNELLSESLLYPPDGIGRIGIILVGEDEDFQELSTHFAVTPERFRIEKKYFEIVDRFLNSHEPDLEIRDK